MEEKAKTLINHGGVAEFCIKKLLYENKKAVDFINGFFLVQWSRRERSRTFSLKISQLLFKI
mgnify:CR=1 FL=1